MSVETAALWLGFSGLIAFLLLIDLKLISNRSTEMTVRAALGWSSMWIGAALLFSSGVFVFGGTEKGFQFLTGYVIEKSLSIDNLFVFLVIFSYFSVPQTIRPKALTWGIIGALFMRLAFILAGAALLDAFHWVIFVFGGFLLLTAFKLAREADSEVHPEKNLLLRGLRRVMPVSSEFHGTDFFLKQDGRLWATPFLVTMAVIASTDLVFALDSIPAIFAITEDPFIVYTSNAFAILGMRALFFALAGVMGYFVYLRQALVLILGFVGLKMIASEWYEVSIGVSLGYVFGVLAVAIVASFLVQRRGSAASEKARGESAD